LGSPTIPFCPPWTSTPRRGCDSQTAHKTAALLVPVKLVLDMSQFRGLCRMHTEVLVLDPCAASAPRAKYYTTVPSSQSTRRVETNHMGCKQKERCGLCLYKPWRNNQKGLSMMI
jgi:hypothetical protein